MSCFQISVAFLRNVPENDNVSMQELQHETYIKMLQEEIEEAVANGKTLRAGRLRKEMRQASFAGTTTRDELHRTRSVWTPSPTEFSNSDDDMDGDPIEALFRADRKREERERKAREEPKSPPTEPEPCVEPPDVPVCTVNACLTRERH